MYTNIYIYIYMYVHKYIYIHIYTSVTDILSSARKNHVLPECFQEGDTGPPCLVAEPEKCSESEACLEPVRYLFSACGTFPEEPLQYEEWPQRFCALSRYELAFFEQ